MNALLRRLRGPYRLLARMDARLADLDARAARLEDRAAEIQAAVGVLARRSEDAMVEQARLPVEERRRFQEEVRATLRAMVSEEAENRRRLHALRSTPGYEAPWREPRPLVSVLIATHGRRGLLCERALPAVLGQSYEELEVIVVGDAEPPETEAAVLALGDPRVRYLNLSQRLRFTEDPYRQWLVGATLARNEAVRHARGRWLVLHDDDDAIRPDCVTRLLEHARRERAEAVYGKVRTVTPEGETIVGVFPPELNRFSWGAGMYHAGLRFLERELVAGELGIPGDWYLAERMLRIGVRFAMLDQVLCDAYPSLRNRGGSGQPPQP